MTKYICKICRREFFDKPYIYSDNTVLCQLCATTYINLAKKQLENYRLKIIQVQKEIDSISEKF